MSVKNDSFNYFYKSLSLGIPSVCFFVQYDWEILHAIKIEVFILRAYKEILMLTTLLFSVFHSVIVFIKTGSGTRNCDCGFD